MLTRSMVHKPIGQQQTHRLLINHQYLRLINLDLISILLPVNDSQVKETPFTRQNQLPQLEVTIHPSRIRYYKNQ